SPGPPPGSGRGEPCRGTARYRPRRTLATLLPPLVASASRGLRRRSAAQSNRPLKHGARKSQNRVTTLTRRNWFPFPPAPATPTRARIPQPTPGGDCPEGGPAAAGLQFLPRSATISHLVLSPGPGECAAPRARSRPVQHHPEPDALMLVIACPGCRQHLNV